MKNKNNLKFQYSLEPSSTDLKKIYDICIIGSGAAGSIAAFELIQAGYKVLMIEQGPFVQKETTYQDILNASEPAYARNASGNWDLIGYPWTSCNVGGGTVFYGGVSFRYRELDFDIEPFVDYSDLPLKWPYSYQELEPYYEKVEQVLGIAGCLAEDPFMSPIHKELPLSPVKSSLVGELLKKAALENGLKPFPTPLAIATEFYRGRKACNYSSSCIEHACDRGSKGGAYNVFLKTLLTRKNFRLFSGLKACYLKRKQETHVSSLETYHVVTGNSFEFHAKFFLVACNAIQSAALLLRSKDRWSPTGIGNNNDMVGRGLCFKLSRYAVGLLPKMSLNHQIGSRSGPFSTISLMDFYLDHKCPTGIGGLIYESNYGNFSTASSTKLARLECILPDVPFRENRIRLTDSKDQKGIPKIIIDYKSHPLDLMRLEYMTERCEELLKKMGCKLMFRENSYNELGSTHLHGTCRAGEDPKTSVVNKKSLVHSTDNLYVIDGAFMPYPGGANPTLTIQAHALKVATELSKIIRGYL